MPGFCRLALEAACVEAVTKRMVREGKSRTEIDAALDVPTKLVSWLALALFEDAGAGRRGDAVVEREAPVGGRRRRPREPRVPRGHPGRPAVLVRAAERLSDAYREMRWCQLTSPTPTTWSRLRAT